MVNMIYIALSIFAAPTTTICANEKAVPLCVDGVTYNNYCLYQVSGVKKNNPITMGECAKDDAVFCTSEWVPVCGKGIVFGNLCMAMGAGIPKYDIIDGECPKPTASPTPTSPATKAKKTQSIKVTKHTK